MPSLFSDVNFWHMVSKALGKRLTSWKWDLISPRDACSEHLLLTPMTLMHKQESGGVIRRDTLVTRFNFWFLAGSGFTNLRMIPPTDIIYVIWAEEWHRQPTSPATLLPKVFFLVVLQKLNGSGDSPMHLVKKRLLNNLQATKLVWWNSSMTKSKHIITMKATFSLFNGSTEIIINQYIPTLSV